MKAGFQRWSVEGGLEGTVFVPVTPPPHPTIVFLHGRGESGLGGFKPILVGMPAALCHQPAAWPFLVVIPQKPDEAKLWPEYADNAKEFLASVEQEFDSDPHRRYLTGLSQGGHGTLMLARSLGWDFAAACAVCGWSTDLNATEKAYHGIPLRLYHGLDDNVILPSRSQEVYDLLKEKGHDVELKLYEGVNHNSWDRAYRDEKLADWFLGHALD